MGLAALITFGVGRGLAVMGANWMVPPGSLPHSKVGEEALRQSVGWFLSTTICSAFHLVGQVAGASAGTTTGFRLQPVPPEEFLPPLPEGEAASPSTAEATTRNLMRARIGERQRNLMALGPMLHTSWDSLNSALGTLSFIVTTAVRWFTQGNPADLRLSPGNGKAAAFFLGCAQSLSAGALSGALISSRQIAAREGDAPLFSTVPQKAALTVPWAGDAGQTATSLLWRLHMLGIALLPLNVGDGVANLMAPHDAPLDGRLAEGLSRTGGMFLGCLHYFPALGQIMAAEKAQQAGPDGPTTTEKRDAALDWLILESVASTVPAIAAVVLGVSPMAAGTAMLATAPLMRGAAGLAARFSQAVRQAPAIQPSSGSTSSGQP